MLKPEKVSPALVLMSAGLVGTGTLTEASCSHCHSQPTSSTYLHREPEGERGDRG